MGEGGGETSSCDGEKMSERRRLGIMMIKSRNFLISGV